MQKVAPEAYSSHSESVRRLYSCRFTRKLVRLGFLVRGIHEFPPLSAPFISNVGLSHDHHGYAEAAYLQPALHPAESVCMANRTAAARANCWNTKSVHTH